jgi:hypothetical protein
MFMTPEHKITPGSVALSPREMESTVKRDFSGALSFATVNQNSHLAGMKDAFANFSGGSFTPINYTETKVDTSLTVAPAAALAKEGFDATSIIYAEGNEELLGDFNRSISGLSLQAGGQGMHSNAVYTPGG